MITEVLCPSSDYHAVHLLQRVDPGLNAELIDLATVGACGAASTPQPARNAPLKTDQLPCPNRHESLRLPALSRLLGNVRGKQVPDLSCELGSVGVHVRIPCNWLQ